MPEPVDVGEIAQNPEEDLSGSPLAVLDTRLVDDGSVEGLHFIPVRDRLRAVEKQVREAVFRAGKGLPSEGVVIPAEGFSDPFPVYGGSATNETTVRSILKALKIDVEKWGGQDQDILEAVEPLLQQRDVPYQGGSEPIKGKAASLELSGLPSVRLELVKPDGPVGGNYYVGLSMNRAGAEQVSAAPVLPPLQGQ